MAKIILVLFLASIGCGCESEARPPVDAGDAGCMCEICIGEQDPVPSGPPECVSRKYSYIPCACGADH